MSGCVHLPESISLPVHLHIFLYLSVYQSASLSNALFSTTILTFCTFLFFLSFLFGSVVTVTNNNDQGCKHSAEQHSARMTQWIFTANYYSASTISEKARMKDRQKNARQHRKYLAIFPRPDR